MSDSNITVWLQGLNLEVTQVSSGYWQVYRYHKYGQYVLHIRIHNGWFSLGAELFAYGAGNTYETLSQFYSFVLNLNSQLNSAKVAEENGRIVLIRDDFLSDIRVETLERAINYFHDTHELVLFTLLHEANRIGLRLERP